LNTATHIVVCERGSSAVELAIILSTFLAMLFGIINIAMILWTMASLHYAAETAARCAAVAATGCTSASSIQSYALSQYFGLSLGGTNPFVYAASGCGNTVTATYTYSLVIPIIGTYSVPLSATACSL
jgi:Flp pilus assembly protein TadG